MNQVGTTTDNRPVVAGVFTLVGTHGIPLDIVLTELEKAGLVVSWPDYVKGALADGHKPSNLRSRIREAVEDVYGEEHAREVDARLELLPGMARIVAG